MTNLIRFEPMHEMISLREAMDRLFNDAFTSPNGHEGGWHVPAVDLYQTDDEIVIKAALPGIKSDDVHILVTGDMVTLKGEFKQAEEKKEKAYHLREQKSGSFERTFALPTDVIADKAKAEDVRPKMITVKAK